MGAYNLKNNAYPTLHKQTEKIGIDVNWLWLFMIHPIHPLWLFSNIRSKFEWTLSQRNIIVI